MTIYYWPDRIDTSRAILCLCGQPGVHWILYQAYYHIRKLGGRELPYRNPN